MKVGYRLLMKRLILSVMLEEQYTNWTVKHQSYKATAYENIQYIPGTFAVAVVRLKEDLWQRMLKFCVYKV